MCVGTKPHLNHRPLTSKETTIPVTHLKLFDPMSDEASSGVRHECDLCHIHGRWTEDWSWYGSYVDEDAGVILKCCGCQHLSESEAEVVLVAKRAEMGLTGRRPRPLRF